MWNGYNKETQDKVRQLKCGNIDTHRHSDVHETETSLVSQTQAKTGILIHRQTYGHRHRQEGININSYSQKTRAEWI